MNTYGKDFSSIYNEQWAFWGPKVWPFISKRIRERRSKAVTVLDLCCGTGSLVKLACDDGYACVGVDVSPHQLAHARRNAPAARFVKQDVRKLALSSAFDVVTCMFDSLNYIRSLRELQGVFRRVRRHLNPGGLFIFDMNTYEGLHDFWRSTSARQTPKCTLITQGSFDEEKALGRLLITGFLKEGRLYRRFQEEHIERGYTRREIEAALRAAGFSFTKYDGRSFAAPGPRCGRLLYVCRTKQGK